MQEDQAHQKLLNKMLTLEHAGEILYRALISKAKDNNVKLIYERLALNEEETARYIEKEILAIDRDRRILVNATFLNLTRMICGLLSFKQLAWILRSALKKRIYSRWHKFFF